MLACIFTLKVELTSNHDMKWQQELNEEEKSLDSICVGSTYMYTTNQGNWQGQYICNKRCDRRVMIKRQLDQGEELEESLR